MGKFVALYGGSFNLSTLAHRAVGAAVRDIVEPDAVWYLVSPQNPHKSTDDMLPFKHRLQMAKLNVFGMNKLVVTDIEEGISQKTGSTAAAETLRELITRYPDTHFAWIMGSDIFVKLHTWHDWKYIVHNVPIIVVPRAGSADKIATCEAAQEAGFYEVADPADLRTQNGWYVLKAFPEGSVSATEERKRMKEGGLSAPRNVHPAVLDYIARNGLRL